MRCCWPWLWLQPWQWQWSTCRYLLCLVPYVLKWQEKALKREVTHFLFLSFLSFISAAKQLINTIAASRGGGAVLSLATQKAGKQLLIAYSVHAVLTFIYITALGVVGENLAHRLRTSLFSARQWCRKAACWIKVLFLCGAYSPPDPLMIHPIRSATAGHALFRHSSVGRARQPNYV